MSERLQIRFVGGADVKPPKARPREIAQVIEAYEDAIATTVIESHPELKRDVIRVSLVAVQDESIGLTFEANLPELSFPAALKISNAIQQKAFDGLAERAKEGLRKIVGFASRHQCEAYLIAESGEQSIQVTLTPATVIPRAFDLVGETILYGEVKRAGGLSQQLNFKRLKAGHYSVQQLPA